MIQMNFEEHRRARQYLDRNFPLRAWSSGGAWQSLWRGDRARHPSRPSLLGRTRSRRQRLRLYLCDDALPCLTRPAPTRGRRGEHWRRVGPIRLPATRGPFTWEAKEGHLPCGPINDLNQVHCARGAALGARLVDLVCPQAPHLVPLPGVSVSAPEHDCHRVPERHVDVEVVVITVLAHPVPFPQPDVPAPALSWGAFPRAIQALRAIPSQSLAPLAARSPP